VFNLGESLQPGELEDDKPKYDLPEMLLHITDIREPAKREEQHMAGRGTTLFDDISSEIFSVKIKARHWLINDRIFRYRHMVGK